MAAPPASASRSARPRLRVASRSPASSSRRLPRVALNVSNDVAEVTFVSSLGSARADEQRQEGAAGRDAERPVGDAYDDDGKADASGEDQAERQSLRFLVHKDQNATGRQEVRG